MPEPVGDMSRGLSVREALLVAAGFVAAAVAFTWPVAAHLSTSLPAGLSDPLLNAWTLAWGSERLAHGLQGFWTPPAFYPYHGTLAYSENLLGISLLVAPVHWIGQNLVLTYNIAFLLSYVIAAAGMYLLVRELTGRQDAALVAAAVYAFCPYRAAQVTHLQVLMAGWLPVALWALHRFLATARPLSLVLFVAAFLLQAFSNTYSLVYSVLPIAAVVGWSIWTRRASRRAIRVLVVAGFATAAALLPLALQYASAWRGAMDSGRDVVRYSARLVSFVQVAPELRYSRWLPGGGPEEGNFFPGFVVLALAVLVAVGWPHRGERRADAVGPAPSRGLAGAAVPYALAGLVAALLSLGPEPYAFGRPLPALGFLYRVLQQVVPGFGVLRVPARFAMVLMLSLSVIGGLGAARLLAAVPGAARRWLVACALVAGIGAEGFAGPVRMSEFNLFRDRDERAAYTALRHGAATPMLELPLQALAREDPTLVYQALALFHRHPVVNGFSRKGTPLQVMLASLFSTPRGIPEALLLLRGLGVEHVVVHPSQYRDPLLGEATIEAIAGDASAGEGWRSTGVAVFRLAKIAERPAREGQPVPGSRIVARASANTGEVSRLFDGDPATRWATGRPQDGTEWLELSFDRPRDIVGLDLVLQGDSLSDYSRDLEVDAIGADGSLQSLYRGTTLAEIGEGLRRDTARVEARLPVRANGISMLRLRQLGTTRWSWWSIYELQVWERDAGRSAAAGQ